MDSFATISFSPASVPVDNDDPGNGQGSGGYCVVFARDTSTEIPSDQDDPGNGQVCLPSD
ncbi:hypothetical protein DFP72DRAFT_1075625 [Ephemerocybe angulata]|uniref:Uncharacterized protein n=1 Tax=Ephemerocybe angulata TaxID=980116 RepID=A0A8H6LZW1_9AGAR|nr:hypothetical protein DFP72DRAFT_1075625 [Tulosesus angulatus]